MAKKNLQGRAQSKHNVGKTTGRSYGPMVYNDIVERMVTQKIDAAIKKNRKLTS